MKPFAELLGNPWGALSGSIVLGSIGQIALKHGANIRKPKTQGWRILFSPWVIAWGVSFLIATGLWMVALRQLDISYAYPLLGLGYALVTALAALVLRERVSPMHWLAVLIITAGAICVARSV